MSEHRSVWRATAASPTYPPLAGDVRSDVVVVGAGITGVTTALLLRRAGVSVTLVESRTVGAGTTGATTGKLTSQHGLCYADLVEGAGRDVAQAYADANQAAIATVRELAGECGVPDAVTPAPAFVHTADPGERAVLEREHDAARSLGLPATLTDSIELPVACAVALRFDDQAQMHPVRYLDALTARFVAEGGVVAEGTRVTAIDDDAGGVVAHTTHGGVLAEYAVVATLLPVVDLGGFFAKARPTRAYGIAARVRGAAPAGMYLSLDEPTRSVRPWPLGSGAGVVVVGEGHLTGTDDATPARWGELERWTRDTFDVAEFAYRWSAQDYRTIDGRPYVGRSPRTQRIWVATGFGKWGLSNGTAAAMILADLVRGLDSAWLPAFDATRVGGPRAITTGLRENLDVAKRFVGDRLARLRADSVEHLARGEGGAARADGQAVGAYRDASGEVHAVRITCTHLGCTLHFNAAERSWDCPCHGSRFDTEGRVLEGPAVTPLEHVPVDER